MPVGRLALWPLDQLEHPCYSASASHPITNTAHAKKAPAILKLEALELLATKKSDRPGLDRNRRQHNLSLDKVEQRAQDPDSFGKKKFRFLQNSHNMSKYNTENDAQVLEDENDV